MTLLQLFCDVDDFCQLFIPAWERELITEGNEHRRRPQATMSASEIMTILIHFHQGSVLKLYAWGSNRGCETGSGRGFEQFATLKPSQVVFEVFAGNAAIAAQEVLQPTMPIVGGLHVGHPSHPLTGALVQRFMPEHKRLCTGRLNVVCIGEQKDVIINPGVKNAVYAFSGDRWKDGASRSPGSVHGNQYANLFVGQAALLGLATPAARLSVEFAIALSKT